MLRRSTRKDYDVFFRETAYNNTPIKVFELGNLNLPTGRVVLSDPLFGLWCKRAPEDVVILPIKTVPPGVYPVSVCVAQLPDWGERFAFARVKFSDIAAIKWLPAVSDESDKKSNMYFVECGMGCFCDEETRKKYVTMVGKIAERNPEANLYDDYFEERLEANNGEYRGKWLNYTVDDTKINNVVMFDSGLGDGIYPSYWGIDANGNITSLVTDFQIF